MKQYLYIVLFFVVLGAPFVLRAVVKHAPDSTTDATTTSGPGGVAGRKLVVITPHNQDIRREFARAFSAWHQEKFGQPVAMDFRVPGGTNDIRRQLEDTYRSWQDEKKNLDPRFIPDIHMAWGGGSHFFNVELKPSNILQPVALDPAFVKEVYPDPSIAGVVLYEPTTGDAGNPTPKWVGTCLSAFGIVYNPDVYAGLGLNPPASWHDLTLPRLAGQLSLADPTHSGSAATAYMVVLQRRMVDAELELFARRPDLAKLTKAEWAKDPEYVAAIGKGWKRGMSELLLIAANARYFTDSSSQVPNDVGVGDAAAGMAIDFYGRVYEQIVGVDRCKMVTPIGATAIDPDPIAVLAGVKGEQLELATRFIQFILSREGQRLWALQVGRPGGPVERALRRSPARADVYADRTGWSDPDVNPFTDSGGFNQRPDFMTYFSDTRPVWTAAWIDSRDALKDAYKKILALPDEARRDQLITELADLPIEMSDVAKANAERNRRKNEGGVEEWMARNRINLTKRFREHYQSIAAKAS